MAFLPGRPVAGLRDLPGPLDYADRADGTVDLALYRRPATDPAHRIGTLFINPGGPGDSTFKMTEKIVATFYPGLAARFDILGMDPRGVGASTPIQCFPTDADWEQALAAFVAVPLTPAETSAIVACLTEDAWVRMPPVPLEYQGRDSAAQFFATVSFRRGRRFRLIPTRANGQPAFGVYLRDPVAAVGHAHGLLVVTLAGDQLSAIAGFDNAVFDRFGLPRILAD